MFRHNDFLADFERLTRGLNLGTEFDQIVDGITNTFAPANASVAPVAGRHVDAVRSGDRYELFIDLPGVDPDSVDLTVDGRNVTVSTHREFAVAKDAELVHAGRRHGSFTRTFRLTDDLDIEGLTARSEHGVLIITVPVADSAQPRRIQISSGE